MSGPLRDRTLDRLRDNDIAAFDDKRGGFDFVQAFAPQTRATWTSSPGPRKHTRLLAPTHFFKKRPKSLADLSNC
jgi:hypothetical protein